MGEYLIVSSTGTYQATATANNTMTGGAGMIVTLKAAGAGGVIGHKGDGDSAMGLASLARTDCRCSGSRRNGSLREIGLSR